MKINIPFQTKKFRDKNFIYWITKGNIKEIETSINAQKGLLT